MGISFSIADFCEKSKFSKKRNTEINFHDSLPWKGRGTAVRRWRGSFIKSYLWRFQHKWKPLSQCYALPAQHKARPSGALSGEPYLSSFIILRNFNQPIFENWFPWRKTAALHHNVQDGCLDSGVKFLSRLVRTNGFDRCIGIGLFEDPEGILVADSRIILVNLLDFLVVSRCCRFDVIVTATGNHI